MRNNYNILIIDDEQHCIAVLTYELIQLGFSSECIFSSTDPLKAQELISKTKVELLFLDIDMPHLTGFELLKKCGDQKLAFIVTTAHQRYALTALKASAVDFLLKPVNSEELKLALDNFENKRQDNLLSSIEKIKAQLASLQRDNIKTISIADTNGFRICNLNHIVAMTADGDYTKIELMHDEILLSSKHLGYYEEILPQRNFFRIHRKHLINADHVQYLDKTDGGVVHLSNTKRYPVARSKMKNLKAFFAPRCIHKIPNTLGNAQ